MPAAAVGIARRNGRWLEWLVLADVSLLIRDRNNGFQVVTDSRVDDAQDSSLREAALNLPIGTAAQRAAVKAMSVDQLTQRNVKDGYWVAAANPEAADHAITGRTAIADIDSVALMTDGVSHLVTLYNEARWLGVMEILHDSGPDALIARVRDAEQRDPYGEIWPRFKTQDDAAVVVMQRKDLEEQDL
ncbi:hypothetical protein DI005_20065 [Prauserella sp. PE36]|nr:hypothetical protein DI005_20065 [Prauserella sp. PE36]